MNGWNVVAILPSGYTPTRGYDMVSLDNATAELIQVKVSTNGNISVYHDNIIKPSNNIRIHGMFAIA